MVVSLLGRDVTGVGQHARQQHFLDHRVERAAIELSLFFYLLLLLYLVLFLLLMV